MLLSLKKIVSTKWRISKSIFAHPNLLWQGIWRGQELIAQRCTRGTNPIWRISKGIRSASVVGPLWGNSRYSLSLKSFWHYRSKINWVFTIIQLYKKGNITERLEDMNFSSCGKNIILLIQCAHS